MPQDGQREFGKTIDSSSGRRWMTTLRKLPMIAPKTPVTTKMKGKGSGVSNSSADSDDTERGADIMPQALYIGARSLPTIFFFLQFPEQEMFQKSMMSGKTSDTQAC